MTSLGVSRYFQAESRIPAPLAHGYQYDDATELPASRPFGIGTDHHFGGDCHRYHSWRVDIPARPGQGFRRGYAGTKPTTPTEGGSSNTDRILRTDTGKRQRSASAA